jgi:sortase A
VSLQELHDHSPWLRRGVHPRAAGVPIAVCGLLVAAGLWLIGQGVFIQAKALVAQVLLEHAWSQTVATGKPVKAWSWADTYPVAKISFPRIGQSSIVLAAGGGEALAFGPAHVAGAPLPGASGTSVIGGHRDTHFTYLRDVKAGDEVVVTDARGAVIRYRATHSVIVHPGASGIATGGRRARLALVTCFPFDAVARADLRYVVFAEAIEPRH